MILGRCGLFVRYASNLSKKRYGRKYSGRSIQVDSLSPIKRQPQVDRIGGNFLSVPSCLVRMASTSTERKKNRLALERSPYLLQHATNPVDWYPWGDEALEKAKNENKMIFLSVGYSTCHWCHVMEKESFVNEEIAAIMNQNFVNIKVDREERPDVDRVYMHFVQITTGHGGWPMSVFLSPNLNPVIGGTYFPPEDTRNQTGFKTVLLAVARQWQEVTGKIMEMGQMHKALLERMTAIEKQEQETVPSLENSKKCVEELAEEYEPEFGGFGKRNSTKFPQPVRLNLMFHVYARRPNDELGQNCLQMCRHTLTKMSYGGIHDHVGQGFSRYSVDGFWHVPHFEKMLYDQGQLMQSYADAFLATKDTLFAEIIDDIATYVTRDLRHKEGGFYSAEDADSYPAVDATAKKEGAFYVWTAAEIKSHLDNDVANADGKKLHDLFCYHFNVKETGNIRFFQDPHGELKGKNVLIAYDGVETTAEHFGLSVDETKARLKEACAILFNARSTRPRPHLDDKFIASWNGLMMSGFARGGAALGNKQYVQYAADAAKFIEDNLFDRSKGVLFRCCYRGENDVIMHTSVRIHGFLEDYAFVVKGLLDLYEASLDDRWIEYAEELHNIQDKLFWDEANGGYFSTPLEDQENNIILRMKEVHDGAEPSGNAIAASNLLRLAGYLNRGELKTKAVRLFGAFEEFLTSNPSRVPQLVSALIDYHDDTTQIYVAGKRDANDTNDLIRVIQERLIPGRILLLADQDKLDGKLFQKHELLSKLKPQDGRATVSVCRRQTCSLPVTSPEELAALLDDRQ